MKLRQQPGISFLTYMRLVFASACFDLSPVPLWYSSRTGGGAAEAGVITLSEFRGHGFAASVTAVWAASVRTSVRTPVYSTWWENLASLSVARRLALTLLGADAARV